MTLPYCRIFRKWQASRAPPNKAMYGFKNSLCDKSQGDEQAGQMKYFLWLTKQIRSRTPYLFRNLFPSSLQIHPYWLKNWWTYWIWWAGALIIPLKGVTSQLVSALQGSFTLEWSRGCLHTGRLLTSKTSLGNLHSRRSAHLTLFDLVSSRERGWMPAHGQALLNQ